MTYSELRKHLESQLYNILCVRMNTEKYIAEAVRRTYNCISKSTRKYLVKYSEDEIPFSVFNTTQYAVFLYHMSRVAYETDKNGENAEKFFCLNKILNSVDIFYAVELPSVWCGEHLLGSVLGRAKYSDYFFFYQGCTVGGSFKDGAINYPEIGEHVIMFSNSKILGRSKIGNNVIISANTYIINEDIPDNCIVFGQSPDIVIKKRSKEEMVKAQSVIWPIE